VTTAIAIYGAVLSTLAVGWHIFSWYERRAGRIKVSVDDNMMFFYEGDPDGKLREGPYVVFSAVNDGEKPVTLSALRVSVRGQSGALYVKCSDLPTTLTEGEEYQQRSDRQQLLDALREGSLQPPWKCTAVFSSNTGREYRKRFVLGP